MIDEFELDKDAEVGMALPWHLCGITEEDNENHQSRYLVSLPRLEP
jgi:hypothetical protein